MNPVVCFGEILLDILPLGEEAGGAPMNVAYHLSKHGINTALISRIGIDDRDKQLLEITTKAMCNYRLYTNRQGTPNRYCICTTRLTP